jgi:phosphatidate cytidylyltransferase
MPQRIFSTVLLWAIVAAVLWFFRINGALILVTVVSVLTLREFYLLMHGAGYRPFDRLGLLLGGLITIEPWLQARFGLPAGHTLALAVVIFSVRILGEREGQDRMGSLGSTLFGLVYVSFMLHYFTRILTPLPGDAVSPDGRLLLALWLIATAKFCDVGGLLAGLAFGRHKMSPQISPKKTWEGAVGGVLVSMGVGALIAWLARDHFPPHLTPLVAALFAIPIALLGIVSDLVESIIKRHAAIKDSGALIPGIGGMFDLSDSLLLVAPVGYLLFRLP